jgi:hypothetical protein
MSKSSLESPVVGRCQRLVRVNSRSGQERAAGDVVLAEMRALGYAQVERDELGSVVGLGQKGRAGLLFEARGVAAQTSQPERGENAVYRMHEAMRRIREVPAKKDEILGKRYLICDRDPLFTARFREILEAAGV